MLDAGHDPSPFPPSRFPAPTVAVIGGGVAGLGAAWLLAARQRVTLFERETRLGGHSHTVEVPGPDGPIPVDTGFIVYNEKNYPNLTRLFRHLGVETRPSSMSFAVSIAEGDLEYAGDHVGALFAQKRNLLRPRMWRMLRDVMRFYRESPKVLANPVYDGVTLRAYLAAEGYSNDFLYDHLLPMGAEIWSCSLDDIGAHPVQAFVGFFDNHGLLQLGHRPQWRTVAGGSREYVALLRAAIQDRGSPLQPGRKALSVRRRGGRVFVTDASGVETGFDRLVIATHADEALALLSDPSDEERDVLSRFHYLANDVVLHGDPTLMPRRRRVWASWNYLSEAREGTGPRICASYWMNRLQSIDPRVPLFVTLNPVREPDPATVHARFVYDHPQFDASALAAQRRLPALQGVRNTWFCGSYFGHGFHEDALASGLAAAESAGGAPRPWGRADQHAVVPAVAAE